MTSLFWNWRQFREWFKPVRGGKHQVPFVLIGFQAHNVDLIGKKFGQHFIAKLTLFEPEGHRDFNINPDHVNLYIHSNPGQAERFAAFVAEFKPIFHIGKRQAFSIWRLVQDDMPSSASAQSVGEVVRKNPERHFNRFGFGVEFELGKAGVEIVSRDTQRIESKNERCNQEEYQRLEHNEFWGIQVPDKKTKGQIGQKEPIRKPGTRNPEPGTRNPEPCHYPNFFSSPNRMAQIALVRTELQSSFTTEDTEAHRGLRN